MRAWIIAMAKEAALVEGRLKRGDRLYLSGIGKVNAAAATARAIAEGAEEVRNFGLAGGFGETVRVGGVYQVERAVQYDFDLSELDGVGVGEIPGRSGPYFRGVVNPALGFPARTLATGDRFVDSETDARLIRSLGAELRDMEGAAIAQVCEAAGVPFAALKCVCDVYGQGQMTGQYYVYVERALECLSDAVTSWM